MLNNTNPVISKTLECFRNDGVILFPSDTLWGLSCSIESEKGVERIYDIKQRPRTSPLILMVSHLEMLKEYVSYIHPRVETMLEYHKRPLTVIYKDLNDAVPGYLKADDGSVAIRIATNEFCKNIIDLLGHPITTTSANVHGEETAMHFSDISESVRSKVDFILPTTFYTPSFPGPSKIARFDRDGELDFIR